MSIPWPRAIALNQYWRCITVIVLVLGYYGVFDRVIPSWSFSLTGRLRIAALYPFMDVAAVVRLTIATIFQLVMLFFLLAVSPHVPWVSVQARGLWANVVDGLLLGIGEFAFSSVLCYACMRFAILLVPAHVPESTEEWVTLVRSGWMRGYLKAAELLPIPAFFVLIITYIAGEELVFRGVVIGVFRFAGEGVALAASLLLFVAIQCFGMPGWKSALFPVVGALVIGVINGVLMLKVAAVLPLITAHVAFFLMALMGHRGRALHYGSTKG